MPSSEALKGDHFGWKDGAMRFLGYHVGIKQGLPTDTRKSILDYVYNERLPRVNSEEYMKEWGEPRTAKRLHKMADFLAAEARNAKRRKGSDMTKAIEEWEDDLAYLKVTYYDGRYDRKFIWPSTEE